MPPLLPTWTDLRPFAADLWLAATIVAVLLTPFFVRRPNVPCALVTLAGLLAALAALLKVGPNPGGVSGGAAARAFAGMLVNDRFAFFWNGLLLLFVAGVVVMWAATTGPALREGDGPEFFVLLLGATLGMSLMGGAANLLMLVLSVELASLPSYVLAGFRKTHRFGAEAALKYVLFGAVSSAVMIYGVSLLYGLYGTLRLYGADVPGGAHAPGLAELFATAPVGAGGSGAGGSGGGGALLAIAVGGILIGLGFKIAAVPFHFWCPDVFEGAGMDVVAFLSVASKGAGLVLLLRVMTALAAAYRFAPSPALTTLAAVIGVLGALTATVGNTAAFVQDNIKRLLAYSSIAHAGYMLCAVSLLVRHGNGGGAAGGPGAEPTDAAAQAILLYLAVYLFMNLGAFTAAGLVWARTGSERLEDYSGLGRRAPLTAACMAAFLFSLVGLPPLAGFAAKLNLMVVLGAGGGWEWALVAAVGVNTVLSLYYYARVVRLMYLTDAGGAPLRPSALGVGLCATCATALVLMLLGFGPLKTVTARYGRLPGPPPGPVAPAASTAPPAVTAAR